MSGSYNVDKLFSKQNIFSARYWDDPHTFNPSRFLKDWPRDAFVPFSSGKKFFSPLKICPFLLLSKYAGARACIGRKYVDFTVHFNQSFF